MSKGAITQMSPAKNSQKSVTPESVKALMILEAGIAGFLAYWLYSEYQFNIYFRQYIDSTLLQHFTTYTMILGIGIGLAGSAVAATLYRNLQHAKTRLETVGMPKIKGTVEKIVASIPTIDEKMSFKRNDIESVSTESRSFQLPAKTTTTQIVPLADEKKSA